MTGSLKNDSARVATFDGESFCEVVTGDRIVITQSERVPDGDQVFRLSECHAVKTCKIRQHLIGNIQLSKGLTGLDGSQNIIKKMWIDLGLEKLVF